MVTKAKTIAALVLSAAVIGLLSLPKLALAGVLLVLTVIGQWELLTLARAGTRLTPTILGCLLFVACATSRFSVVIATLLAVFMVHLGILVVTKDAEAQRSAMQRAVVGTWNWVYVAMPMGMIARLWIGPDALERVGFLFFATTLRNISAGLIGPFLSGHPISWANPRKTWEGAALGLAVTVAVALVLQPLVFRSMSRQDVLILSLLIGIVGQMGDLAESIIKRQYGAVDSGQILPGQGGVLDTVDSFLFTGPVLYFFYELRTLDLASLFGHGGR